MMNYAYWLSNIPGIGNKTIHRLMLQAGTAREVYFLKEQQLAKIAGLGEKELHSITNSKKEAWENCYERMCSQGIAFLSEEEDAFPDKLRHIPDAPYSIYIKGRLPNPEKKAVAVVGARMCSEYGYAVAKELGKSLAVHGACVISGMANGIDAAGHIGALETGGETFAVLGCGADICYPWSNRTLYTHLSQQGGIISEYPPGTKPIPGFFPARNRIISGFSDMIVVVEAKERSGSLITADLALEQGKDVYAVPGRIFDPLSAGCNSLVRQGAGIITNVEDFIKEINLCQTGILHQENFNDLLLEKDERLVYSCVDLRPKSIEELLRETKLDMPEMAGILAKLVQKEFVAETFKNCYIRKI